MRLRRKVCSESGATLIEVLAVAAIVGVLAAIAVPMYMSYVNSTKADACKSNLRAIYSAQQIWAKNNNKNGPDAVTMANIIDNTNTNAVFISAPTCPASGTYTLTTVEAKPTCSVSGHVLP